MKIKHLKFLIPALLLALLSCTVMPRQSHRAKVGPKHYTKPMKGFHTPIRPIPKKK